MKTWATEESVRTLRFCRTCNKETPHEIHAGEGSKAYICVPCTQRHEIYEQDMDSYAVLTAKEATTSVQIEMVTARTAICGRQRNGNAPIADCKSTPTKWT